MVILLFTQNAKRSQSNLQLVKKKKKKKKREKLKKNILLEVTDDIIIKYPNTKDIQQKPVEKCNREGMSIDKVILFMYIKNTLLSRD